MEQMTATEILRRHIHGAITKATGREIELIPSRQEVDGDGEVIVTRGMNLTRYQKNPVLLLQHNPERRIGRMTSLVLGRVEGADALIGRATLRDADVAAEVAAGTLNGVSIGFRSLERGAPILPGQTGVTHVRTELMEVSLVALPSCASCVVIAKAFGGSRAAAPVLTRQELTRLVRECVVRSVNEQMPQFERHLTAALLKARGRVD